MMCAMPYAFLASALVVFHFGFVLFVIFGAALLFRWPGLVWLHVPALAWGLYIEFSRGVCPLTPLENQWRAKAGQQGYDGGFIEHYMLPLIYPNGITPTIQMVLGIVLVVLNVALYGFWIRARLAA